MGSNPGDSGAPVFLTSGEVVAVKVGGYEQAQNLNEIIPLSYATPLLTEVGDKEKNCALVKEPDDGRLPPSRLSMVLDGRSVGTVTSRLEFACGHREHSFNFAIEWLGGEQYHMPNITETCSDKIQTAPGTEYDLMLTIGPKPPTNAAGVVACKVHPR
jgi:hypothetical protein